MIIATNNRRNKIRPNLVTFKILIDAQDINCLGSLFINASYLKIEGRYLLNNT